MADRQPAPKDGIQVYNGQRFRAIRGELMMPGAKFEDHAATEAAHQKYLKDQAKAKGSAGPSKTTASTGPEQQS